MDFIEGKCMFGIDDFWVALPYMLCIVSTVLCIVYSKVGVISSMLVGFVITTFWMLFVKVPEINAFKLVSKSILADKPKWPVVDILIIALPASILTAVVVSFLTNPPDEKHLQRCFNNKKQP